MLIHPQIRSEALALLQAGSTTLPKPPGQLHSDENHWVWVLDDFLALLAESHEQPTLQLRPMIRRLLIEKMFMDHTGDSMHHATGNFHLEKQVDHIVTTLEQVRQHALSRGQWSDQPSPPLMCG